MPSFSDTTPSDESKGDDTSEATRQPRRALSGRTFVIVGAGLAGARAAQTLRDRGFDGRVVLLGDENVRPYDRVTLSKHYLMSQPGYHPLYIHDKDYYESNEIELETSTTTVAIDTEARTVTLSDARQLTYDRLLLATGAEPRRLNIPGSDLAGIHYLRTMADADSLKKAMATAEDMVVIGGGFIGCEVAAAARRHGTNVAIVGTTQLPLEGPLGSRMATFFRDVHVAHGVEFHMGTQPVEFVGGAEFVGGTRFTEGGEFAEGAGFTEASGLTEGVEESTVQQVVLADGTRLDADLVVVGIGATPRVSLALAAGITVDNGILTNEFLETSAPGVYAAGDVANAWHPGYERHIRLGHWSSALNQGPIAARNMMNEQVPYNKTPFFFSDQFDIWMEYTGHANPDSQLVIRGDDPVSESSEFVAFWLTDGVVTAGMNVNITDIRDTVADLVNSGRRVDPKALVDTAIDLTTL